MALKMPGWHIGVSIVLNTYMGKKNSKKEKRGSLMRTSAANIFNQQLHAKELMDSSLVVLRSSKTNNLDYSLVATDSS